MSDIPIPLPPIGGFQSIPLNQVVGSAMPLPGNPTYGYSYAPLPALPALPPVPISQPLAIEPTRILGALNAGPPPINTAYGSAFPSMGGATSSWPTGAPAGRFGGLPGPASAVGQIPQLGRGPLPPFATAGVTPGPTSAYPIRALPAGSRGTLPALPGQLPQGPTAQQAVGGPISNRFAGPTAATSSGSTSMLSRIGNLFRRGSEQMAGRGTLTRAGIAILPGLAGSFIPQTGGRWDDAARSALTGAGLGASVAGVPGAVVGGVGMGVIGWLTGDDGDDGGDVQEKVNERYERVLTQYGATPQFIRQAQQQFKLSWEVQGGEEGLPRETVEQLANEVLNGMIGVWQQQQAGGPFDPFGDAREQLEQAREYDLAQIAAQQAWQQPLVEQVLAQQQSYADQSNAAAMAMAGQISDPQLAAAAEAIAQQMSTEQATNNAMMLQQMTYAPQAMRDQIDAQFADIMQDIALQEAQYQAEILAAGGTLPGAQPVIGGIPLAPMGAAPPSAQAIPFDPTSLLVPPSTDSSHVIRAEPYDPLSSAVAPLPGAADAISNAPPTASPPTTSPINGPNEAPQATVPQAVPGAGGLPVPPTTAPGSESAPWNTPTPTAPASEQAAAATHATLTQWMGDLVSQGIGREGAVNYAVANGFDATMAAMAYDAASAQDRSIPTTGTTVPGPSGFAGQSFAGAGGLSQLLAPMRGDPENPDPTPTPEAARILRSMSDDPSDGELQAVYNALTMVMGYTGTEANMMIHNELNPPAGRITATVGTAPPPPTLPPSEQQYDRYGMFPQQITDMINRTRWQTS